jgi:dolichyl-phosphate-mannose-protein mannosyltransferase
LTLPRSAIIAVIAITIFRLIVAAHYPLTEDESYYWSWSKHLAFGYTDHPPMVAWLIALTSFLGQSPLAVRLPFILCEALAALAAGAATIVLSRDARAGAAAAIAVALIPQTRWMLGEALPDGPFLLCWALTLWFAARVANTGNRRDFIALGFALGGALLSRFFGWALVAGVIAFALAPQRRLPWRQGLWLALVIAVLCYAPFVAWNATHGWSNFAFTFHNRQSLHVFSFERLAILSTLRLLAVAALLWAGAYFTAIRPGHTLLAWTILPLPILLVLLAPFAVVESYWVLGPAISLLVGIGIAYARSRIVWKRAAIALAVLPVWTMLVVSFPALPEPTQAAILQESRGSLKGPFYTASFMYRPLAADVRALTATRSAAALTDRVEICSELLYNGVDSQLIGSAPQVPQWRWWHPAAVPERALIVTFAPLALDPDVAMRATRAFQSVRPGPVLHYDFAGTSAGTFYTIWVERPKAGAETWLFESGR